MFQEDERACDPVGVQAQFDAGHDPSAGIRHLSVKVHSDFAVAAFYLDGDIQLNPETVLSGVFRCTMSLMNDGGKWKMLQYHFSPLDPM